MGRWLSLLIGGCIAFFFIGLSLLLFQSVRYLDAHGGKLTNGESAEAILDTKAEAAAGEQYGDDEPEEDFELEMRLSALERAKAPTAAQAPTFDVDAIIEDKPTEKPPASAPADPLPPAFADTTGRIRPPNPAEPLPSVEKARGQGNYYVIVGSFKQLTNAKNEVERMKQWGFPNARIEDFGSRAWSVVVTDNYPAKRQAVQIVQRLKERHNLPAYIRMKK